jgi:hypothetical protein
MEVENIQGRAAISSHSNLFRYTATITTLMRMRIRKKKTNSRLKGSRRRIAEAAHPKCSKA